MRAAALLAVVLQFGCGSPASPAAPRPPAYLNMPRDGRTPAPARLSETGAFADVRTLTPAAGLVAYAVNLPFWSDDAEKWRWLALPAGAPIRFAAGGEWGFPAGTVFVKHFASDGRRLETRLLVCNEVGVSGVTYRWRADESDADRVDAAMTASGHYFPGPDDCQACHLPAVGVLGVNTRQLNRPGPDSPENQLVAWSRAGFLAPAVSTDDLPHLPRLAAPADPDRSAEDRARSYLDANCGSCHRPGGAAADFDARYDTPPAWQGIVGAPARIDLGLDRARQVAPNDPWRSVVLARVATTEATKMPPLGHLRPDPRGVAVLREWIASLPGPPVVPPPAIEPAGGDFAGPVAVAIRHADPVAVVRYTLDGRPPGEASAVYISPLRLTGPTTVRARAFKAGHTRSVVAQDTFVVGE